MLNAHRATFRTLAVLAAATALAAANAGGAAAAPSGPGAAIPLNVGQETTGSNTGAHGFFSYTVAGSRLCYILDVQNLSAQSIGAHIHLAPRKADGGIVIPLSFGTGTDWTVTECITPDSTVLAAVAANPRSYYVNVHTPTFRGGEIRGQLK